MTKEEDNTTNIVNNFPLLKIVGVFEEMPNKKEIDKMKEAVDGKISCREVYDKDNKEETYKVICGKSLSESEVLDRLDNIKDKISFHY